MYNSMDATTGKKADRWVQSAKPIGYKSQGQISQELNQFAKEERIGLDIRIFQAIFGIDQQFIPRKILAGSFPCNLQTADMKMLRGSACIGYSPSMESRFFVPEYVSPNDEECKLIAQNIRAHGVQSLDPRAIIAILSDQNARPSIVQALGIKRFDDAASIFDRYDWRAAMAVYGPSHEKQLCDSMRGIINAVRSRFSC